jgi:hypothetical protein
MSSSLAAQFKSAALFVRFNAKIGIFGHKMPHTVTGATSGNAACPFIYNFFDCELRGSEGALGLARARPCAPFSCRFDLLRVTRTEKSCCCCSTFGASERLPT